MDDLTKASDAELASALTGASYDLRAKIMLEVKRRKEVRRAGQSDLSILETAKPFDPRTDISADARYLWKNAFIWFWIVPAAAIALYFLIASLK
jgi:hypothetical protein